MSEEDREFQLIEWDRRSSNDLIKAACSLEERAKWMEEGEGVAYYINMASYLREEAEGLWPTKPLFPMGENVVIGPWPR